MSHYTYGTATSSFSGKITNSQLGDITLRLGGQFADVGTDNELNADTLSQYSTTQQVFYRPPEDLSAGFYNLSLQLKGDADSHIDGEGFGYARTFPEHKPLAYTYDYSYKYNYDSSISGVSFSVCVLPVVMSVSPAFGSIAGGTTVTIGGSGFSTNMTDNVVYVGGKQCTVTSAKVGTIVCVTAAARESATLQALIDTTSEANPTFIDDELVLTSPRPYGSTGWWVKMWDWTAYSTNTLTPEKVLLSVGLRQELSFSFYTDIGTSWPTTSGFASTNVYPFVADYVTILVAPYSGYYYFMMSSDDSATLFGVRDHHRKNDTAFDTEKLLLSTTYSANGNYYANPLSPPMTTEVLHLSRGERYKLRVHLVNSGGADFIELNMKVVPDRTVDGLLIDTIRPINDTSTTPEVNEYENADSVAFLQHHAQKDIQVIKLSMDYRLEKQTIVISGITSGSFSLIVQSSIATDSLDTSSSASTIANYLAAAAAQLSSSAECTSFSVTKSLSADGQTIYLGVTFNVDNNVDLSMLDVYTGGLDGSNVTYSVRRTQEHTKIPSGSLAVTYTSPTSNRTYSTSFDYASTPLAVQTALMTMNSKITVDVSRSGGAYNTGYTWTLTFLTPRGQVPLLSINTTSILGNNVTGTVVKAVAGDNKALWFSPIPAHMTEVPLSWKVGSRTFFAAGNEWTSSVEVLVHTNSGGDVLKSVCDASGNGAAGYLGRFKGDEGSCGYAYSGARSPIVSNFSLSTVDTATTRVTISGNHFDLVEDEDLVTVTIADHPCNITSLSATFIGCPGATTSQW
eukprot:gene36305-44789_t